MLLTIDKLIYGGDGLARTPPDAGGRSMAVFIPFVLPGEQLEAEIKQEKAGFARGTVTRIVEPSPDRVEAPCPHFRQCGGCHYQHIRYERQIQYKADILRETLRRIAKVELKEEIRMHPSPPWSYRNRTRLRVQTAPEFAVGYYRFGSHDFLAVRECPISSPLINQAIASLIEIRGGECPSSVDELELFVDGSDERLTAWAFCGKEAGAKSLGRWADTVQGEVPEIGGMTFFSSRRSEEDSPEALRRIDVARPQGLKPNLLKSSPARLKPCPPESVTYRVGEFDYQVSAGAFFQVNRHLIDELVATVTTGAGGDLALDLYAGVGLFSVPLARIFHHIFAVEASQISHADLVQNVPANVKAVRARTEDHLRGRPSRKRPDLVVLDPPRAGLGKVVTRSLVELGAPRVRYVSCDPATLARDLAPLLASGYRIEEAHLFDLFPQTFHIETVMLLAR
jgi:23S rRNA (uracil1939-C5)-methyltransferase